MSGRLSVRTSIKTVPYQAAANSRLDELCRPWVLVLTPGNIHDSVMAQPCVSLIPGISELLADKGYDSNAFRKFLKDQGD